jgi:hypothetical protein
LEVIKMKAVVVALTTLVATMSLTVPVTAQIRNPSQDFFQQGRERLEREIQIIQEKPLTSEQRLQNPQSEPLLEVRPTPTSDPSQKPNEVEIPRQKPNQGENRGS